MVFVVPLATSNFTVLGFDLSFTGDPFEIVKVSVERILTLVALAAWAWDILRRGGRIRHSPVDWAVLGLVIWMAITTATSVHWPTALLGRPRRYEGLVTFANYALLYFLAHQLVDEAWRIRRLAQTLFWSSVIVALFGISQFLGLQLAGWKPLGFEATRAFATYGNPDFLGGFLVFTVTVALGLALMERRPLWRMVYWVGFAINGVALIVTFTRGAWIGGFIALVLLAVAAWRQRVSMHRVDWIPAGASIVVAAAIVWRSFASSSEVLNFGKRLASIFQFGTGSGQTRTQIWEAAVTSIRHRPVQGWGPDTFRLVFTKYKPLGYVQIKGGSSGADNAHNYYLQLASGSGIPGTLIFCGLFVWAAVRSFGTVFKKSGEPGRVILAAFWAASAGYLVHLLFGLSVTGVTFLLWIGLGLTLVPTSRLVHVKAVKWGAAAASAIVVLALAGVVLQGVALAADGAYQTSQTAATAEDRTAAAEKAERLNSLNPEYRLNVGLAYLAKMQADLQAGAQAQQAGQSTAAYARAVESDFAKAETAFKDATAFNPDEYDNYVALATLYNLAGAAIDKTFYQRTIDTAQQGIAVMPLGTAIRVQLARALAETGKTDETIKTLEYVVEIDPGNGEAAVPLASIYQQMGRTQDALALLKGVAAHTSGQKDVEDYIKELESATSSG
jgi:O-antigen ligase